MTATVLTEGGICRQLGQSSIDVSPMGLGYWAIGGPFWLD